MKQSELKLMIRQVVREEFQLAMKEMLIELRQSKKQVVENTSNKKNNKKEYSKNSILNDVLNETANGDDWKTLGGTKYTTERMSEVVGGSYGDIMSDNSNSNTGVTIDGQTADFLQKDYRGLMKKIKEKRG